MQGREGLPEQTWELKGVWHIKIPRSYKYERMVARKCEMVDSLVKWKELWNALLKDMQRFRDKVRIGVFYIRGSSVLYSWMFITYAVGN